ncbi:O-antigen ligase family protein [bacterium]|nr:O-antigen ligase family protein [bacterium]
MASSCLSWVAAVHAFPWGSPVYLVGTAALFLAMIYGVIQSIKGDYFTSLAILAIFAGADFLYLYYLPHNRWLFVIYYSIACGLALISRTLAMKRLWPRGTGITQKVFFLYALWSGLTLILVSDVLRATVWWLHVIAGFSLLALFGALRPNREQTTQILYCFLIGQQSYVVTSLFLRNMLGISGKTRFTLPGMGANQASMIMGAGLMVALHLFLSTKAPRRRLVFAFCIATSAFGVLLSMTRGAGVAVAIGGAIMVLSFARASGRKMLLGAVIAVSAYLCFLGADFMTDGYITSRFEKGFKQKNLASREDIWGLAAHIFKENPIMGTGIGSFWTQFEYWNPRLRAIEGRKKGTKAHNETVRVAVETGSIGLLLFIGWHLTLFLRTIRSRPDQFQVNARLPFFVYVVLSGFTISYRSMFVYFLFGVALEGWYRVTAGRPDKGTVESRSNSAPRNRLTGSSRGL